MLLYSFKPLNTFSQKLETLFDEYPSVDLQHMGFSGYWKEHLAWVAENMEILRLTTLQKAPEELIHRTQIDKPSYMEFIM